MSRPTFRDGGVVFQAGTILAVGLANTLRQSHPDATIEDLGDAIILPGLVNAHTHLELSNAHPIPLPEGGFVAWLRAIREQSQAAPADLEKTVIAATQAGIDQCLKFGVTAVGDITRHPHLTRPLLQDAGLMGTSYGEIIAAAKLHDQLESKIASATEPGPPSAFLRPGLSPHAPYTVEAAAYQRCLEISQQGNFPLATHLAESPFEAEFLAHHTGPFRDLWRSIGLWDPPPTTFPGGPIRLAHSLGLLCFPTLLAHVNYCDDDELALLAAGRASVVYCPRTHAYFQHPPHRWRDMLAAGINVAIGSDSCASSPNLNLVDDLRLLHTLAPEVPVQTLWHLATTHAARAIRMHTQVGSVDPGKSANFTVFKSPAPTSDPLCALLESSLLPHQTYLAGRLAFAASP